MHLPLVSSVGLTLVASLALPASAAVSIDWVTIGDAGNAAQSAANRSHSFSGGDGFGAVAYTYRMSRNETTIAQYVDFLNAVAATDTYGLYDTRMGTDPNNTAGIVRSGSSGSYSYSVTGSGDRPIGYVNWWDAARFSNWLQNGQGSGDTEIGAYTLNGATSGIAPARNVGATVWIPTENEWFKAAYYDPSKDGSGGYWLHANQSDSMTSNNMTVAGAANYNDGNYAQVENSLPSRLSDVGAYGTDSQSYYGINDMAGNVFELNDLNAESGSSRGFRGGSWIFTESYLRSSFSYNYSTTTTDHDFGFRLASIPEPSSCVLTMLFCAGLVARRSR